MFLTKKKEDKYAGIGRSNLGRISIFLSFTFTIAFFCIGMIPYVSVNLYEIKVDREKVPSNESTKFVSIDRNRRFFQECPAKLSDLKDYKIDVTEANYQNCWTFLFPNNVGTATRSKAITDTRLSYVVVYGIGLLISLIVIIIVPILYFSMMAFGTCVEVRRNFSQWLVMNGFAMLVATQLLMVGVVTFLYNSLLEFFWTSPNDPQTYYYKSMDLNYASTYRITNGHYFFWVAIICGLISAVLSFHASYHFMVGSKDEIDENELEARDDEVKIYKNSMITATNKDSDSVDNSPRFKIHSLVDSDLGFDVTPATTANQPISQVVKDIPRFKIHSLVDSNLGFDISPAPTANQPISQEVKDFPRFKVHSDSIVSSSLMSQTKSIMKNGTTYNKVKEFSEKNVINEGPLIKEHFIRDDI